MDLRIHRLNPQAFKPIRAYTESAGWDLSAFLRSEAGHLFTVTIAPNTTKLIPTGLALLPPPNHLVLICSRSGLATKSVFVANAPGVIDPDYTGEVKIILFNGGMEPLYVKHGDRIAQALVVPFARCELKESLGGFAQTERGEKGFGSTGL